MTEYEEILRVTQKIRRGDWEQFRKNIVPKDAAKNNKAQRKRHGGNVWRYSKL